MPRIAVILFALAAMGAAPPSRIDVSGAYTSNWGRVTLTQHGAHVVGDYVYQHGHLEGTLDGNMLRYAWTESDGHGHGVFVVASDGELIGTWGVGDDDTRGGGWRLVPASTRIARD